MHEVTEAELIRIFVGENEKHQGTPLYEAIVQAARKHDLAGATVLQGVMGYRGEEPIHTAKILRLSEQLPMVVEIVDTAEKVQSFLPTLAGLVGHGLVTIERVRILARMNQDPA
jgi:uncharacterized protein